MHMDKLIEEHEILTCLPAINDYVRKVLTTRGWEIPVGKYSNLILDLERRVQEARQQQQQQKQQTGAASYPQPKPSSPSTLVDGVASISFPLSFPPAYEALAEPLTLKFALDDFTVLAVSEKFCRHLLDEHYKSLSEKPDAEAMKAFNMRHLNTCIVPVGEFILSELTGPLQVAIDTIPRGQLSAEMEEWVQGQIAANAAAKLEFQQKESEGATRSEPDL